MKTLAGSSPLEFPTSEYQARRKARLSPLLNVMRYTPHDDISFCRVESGLIFLDVRKDQYFRLSNELESVFVDCWENDGRTTGDVSHLLKRNILTPVTAATDRPWVPSIDVPVSSAFESFPVDRTLRITQLLEVLGIVASTRFQLRLRPLREILNSLVAYRRSRAPPPFAAKADSALQRLKEFSTIFRRARPYVPIEPSCLLDSIALARFLARRGLHADVVFGVTGDPFSAHCWLQIGTMVLNDSVGNVDSYTPIRVI